LSEIFATAIASVSVVCFAHGQLKPQRLRECGLAFTRFNQRWRSDGITLSSSTGEGGLSRTEPFDKQSLGTELTSNALCWRGG
jgi:hypothetical protein